MLKIQVCKGLSQKHQRQISRAGDSPTPSEANDAEASHGGHQLLHLGFLGIPKSVMQVYIQNQVFNFFGGFIQHLLSEPTMRFDFVAPFVTGYLKHLHLTTVRNFRSEIPRTWSPIPWERCAQLFTKWWLASNLSWRQKMMFDGCCSWYFWCILTTSRPCLIL